MANAVSIANTVAILAVDAVTASFDLDTPPAIIRIYDGTAPADVDTALSSNTLLAELPMSNPAFLGGADAAPGAVDTADTITDDSSANATGSPATFFRIETGTASTDKLQGEIGTSGADLNLNTTSITQGDIVSITSMTVTMPET